MTYRVVEKQLDWTGALHLCESLNGTLATVKTPFEQAYLTLLINSLRRPAWISLYNYGVSSPSRLQRVLDATHRMASLF